jgi:phasin family protein
MPADPSATGQNFVTAMNEAMGRARSAAEEFSRMFGGMKMPGMPGGEELMAAHQRNMEALGQANRKAMEGAQAVARRHLELLQQNMTEIGEQVRSLAAPEAPQAKAAKQAELMKRNYEQAVEQARELSQLIQRANGEALELLNQRFMEAMAEVKTLMERAPQPE